MQYKDEQLPYRDRLSMPYAKTAERASTHTFYQHYKLPISDYSFYSSEAAGPIPDKKVGLPGAVFNVYEWRGENGESLHITIREIGLDKPLEPGEPVPLRIDHSCLCMTEPLDGHDCSKQRDLALDAMKKVGRGIMVEVDSPTNEGNGYGRLMVAIDQATNLQRRARREEPLTLQEMFIEHGLEDFDIRRHPEVAALLSYKLEQFKQKGIISEQNPLILLGSSQKKIESITNGHKIPIPFFSLVTTGNQDKSKEDLGYKSLDGVAEPGVYFQYTTTTGIEKYCDFVTMFPYLSHVLKEAKARVKEDEKLPVDKL